MLHARLSPSSSARWLECTASVEASDNYENKTNSAAEWGTNVHFIGEQLIKGKFISVGDVLSEEGKMSFIVDEEMLDCATDYFNYCNKYIDDKSIVLVEEQFDLSSIAPNQFGTSDCCILNGTELHVLDLKTGFNIVNAEENTQAMLYAIGAIDELEDLYDIETITLHIVQTRVNHTSNWTLSYDDLMKFKVYAQEKASEILSGKGVFKPSEKGCKYCLHQAHCEALQQHTEKIIKGTFDELEEIEGKADIISDEHIKQVLDNKNLIIGFIKAVEQVALERIESGSKIDGYKLVESKTNRKWADESLVKSYLEKTYSGVDHYQHKLLPMTKILKLHSKDKTLLDLVFKPKGVPTIVPENDKRQAINSTCDDFNNL